MEIAILYNKTNSSVFVVAMYISPYYIIEVIYFDDYHTRINICSAYDIKAAAGKVKCSFSDGIRFVIIKQCLR
ncbi:hypothetical protein SDC9_154442 [bioreactor metagenome]|uniref:Uncharacterized protein n=1 Tax=bioreactor metagenome TaxID=1076179 RepID=A0A645F0H0_9ZZZZ